MFKKWLNQYVRYFRKNNAFSSDKEGVALLSCNIHGSHYTDCIKLVHANKIKRGQELYLKRDKRNRYDANAIKVFNQKGQRLGYVPKNHNTIVANLMDQYCDIKVIVTKIDKEAWEPITIRLELIGA